MTTLTHARAVAPAVDMRSAPAAPVIPPPEQFCLPAAYCQQTGAFTRDDTPNPEAAAEYWNADRIRASVKWQHHVYAWAAKLIESRKLASALDIGCGPGTKLAKLVAPVCSDVAGVDQPSAVAVAKRLGHPGEYRTIDLEHADAAEAWRTFDVVICSDVIEHLLDPASCLNYIKRVCHERSLVLISTPDRARLHGRSRMHSDKPEHVREWTSPELVCYLRQQGFEIVEVRALAADDAPMSTGRLREWLWRARLAPTSPHRCLAVLCRPIRN